MISWKNLLKHFEDVLLPDNIKQLISPLKLRTALKMMMDAFETAIQFATPTPTQRSIVVLFSTARSWPITLTGASNTIGEFAFTSRSKRTLIKGTDFVVTGQGLNRIFSISNASFDDFLPGEEIVYIENVKGSILSLNLPVFSIVTLAGVKKYAWKLEGQNDDQLQILNDVPTPYVTTDIQHQGTALSTVVTRIDSRNSTYALSNAANGTVVTHNKNTTLFLAFFINSVTNQIDYNITATATNPNQLRVNVPVGDASFSGFLFLITA